MTASLKPLWISAMTFALAGQIVGGDTWFNNAQGYRAFANHFADIANQESAQLLVVGSELTATVANRPTGETRSATCGIASPVS